MYKIKYLSVLLMTSLMVFGIAGLANASVPTLPSSFYGEIEINDSPPSAGIPSKHMYLVSVERW
jgi:hypothetical protein